MGFPGEALIPIIQQRFLTEARPGKHPPQEPGVLELPPLPDEQLAALVSALSENGAGVVGLTAQTKNLEEIFLSLTQNPQEVV